MNTQQLNNISVVYTDSDIYNLLGGECYYDTRDNKYYIYYNTGAIETPYAITSLDISNYTNYTNYQTYITTSNTYDEKGYIKEYLKNNPELLDELICEIRKDKIQNILKK